MPIYLNLNALRKNMEYKKKLKKISEHIYELPKQGRMLVPGRIFSSSKMLCKIEEKALEQLANIAMLPGIQKFSIGLPDIHTGYGFPIGGVAVFDINKGVIPPGGVGYDINCSVRLLKTNLNLKDIEKNKAKIIESLFKIIPCGLNEKSKLNLNDSDLKEILINGAQWAVSKDYGNKKDYLYTEELGKIKNANPRDVSQKAKARGKSQLGSLGSGNHFLEMQIVDEIYNEKIAKILGLKKGQITFMIHCGSRGLGHQIAKDYIQLFNEKYNSLKQIKKSKNNKLNNRINNELISAPIKSELGKKYLSAMACAGNFSFANKQLITHQLRESLKNYFPNFRAEVVYDICHNIAKFEKQKINNKQKKVLVIRKGATRSFCSKNELPKKYQSIGLPVLIPGSMGTASYILIGTKKSQEISFSSMPHGAGRIKSRMQARKIFNPKRIKKELDNKNIFLKTKSLQRIAEEAPKAYKNINEIIKITCDSGIGDLIVKLKPLGVIKG